MKAFWVCFYLLFSLEMTEIEKLKNILEEVFTDALEQAYLNVEEKIRVGKQKELSFGGQLSEGELEEIAEKVGEILKEKHLAHKRSIQEPDIESYHHKILTPEKVVYIGDEEPHRRNKRTSKNAKLNPFQDLITTIPGE